MIVFDNVKSLTEQLITIKLKTRFLEAWRALPSGTLAQEMFTLTVLVFTPPFAT